MSYFALSLPELNCDTDPSGRVYDTKEDALKALKTNKNSRLKSFSTLDEALKFASDYAENNQILESGSGLEEITPIKPGNSGEGCIYKSLTPQELKQLKQCIEKEDVETFEKLIKSNPRYLMTPCDTPSVLHSGTRSNALHVAAQVGSVKMTEKLLDAIQDPDLMMKMYPNDSIESRVRRQEYLFDMYLNAHKKGDLDTPLHQASKFGHHEVVKLLSGFSTCDAKRINRDGLTPAEVACTRTSPVDIDVKNRIIDYLSDHLYIPVFRSMDLSTPAFVGDPLSPAPSSCTKVSMVDLRSMQDEIDGSPKSAVSPLAQNRLRSPLLVTKARAPITPSPRKTSSDCDDPLTSPLAVRALLGPVSPVDAGRIQQEWKKPDHISKMLRLTDPQKGLERQGRELARKYKTGILEFWDFLDAYADFSTKEGLTKLEDHLKATVIELEDKEAQKLLDLERELADLDIMKASDLSFESTTESKSLKTFTSNGIDFCGTETSVTKIMTNTTNVGTIQSANECRASSSPLPDSVLWFQPRQQDTSSSLNSTGISDISFQLNTPDKHNSEELSEGSSFHSAASSLNDSMLTADEGQLIFLEGPRPTSADYQVYQIIKNVEIDASSFPNIHSWFNVVSSVPEEIRLKWKPLPAKEGGSKFKNEVGKRLNFED